MKLNVYEVSLSKLLMELSPLENIHSMLVMNLAGQLSESVSLVSVLLYSFAASVLHQF